jgi:phosphatidate cytidylyltransferase
MILLRVVSSIVLMIFCVWVIFFSPVIVGLSVVLIFSGIAGFEWARLSGLTKRIFRLFYAVFLVGLVFALQQYSDNSILNWVFGVNAFTVFMMIFLLARMRAKNKILSLSPLTRLFFGVIVVVPAMLALFLTWHELGKKAVLFLLLYVWVADITAFFVGRSFGKHKLLAVVSPKKSWEGVYGALLGGLCVFVCFALVFPLEGISYGVALAFGLVIVVYSVAGDLTVSFVKRVQGVKDSGVLIPGHGGLLDRLDGLVAAAPLYYLGFSWIVG